MGDIDNDFVDNSLVGMACTLENLYLLRYLAHFLGHLMETELDIMVVWNEGKTPDIVDTGKGMVAVGNYEPA